MAQYRIARYSAYKGDLETFMRQQHTSVAESDLCFYPSVGTPSDFQKQISLSQIGQFHWGTGMEKTFLNKESDTRR